MLITEILSRNARIYGEETALIEREPERSKRQEITWKQFDEFANIIAQVLIARGVKPKDRVVQLMTNCIEWLPIYFGILRTGAIVVPLNFRFSSEDIQRCIDLSNAAALIFGEEFIERISKVKASIDKTIKNYIFIGKEDIKPFYAESYKSLIENYKSIEPKIEINLLSDAALYFTSGTTGKPKAALLTHRNLEFACYIENRHHFQTHEDNFLCIPPLYHTGAKMHWFGNFIVGAKSVILKGIKPKWILETVSEEKVSIVWLLVPWAMDILNAIERGEVKLCDYNLDSWRLMHIGAQPVPLGLTNEWKKIFPNHEFDINYGLTESTGPGCVHLGIGNTHKAGGIGKAGFDWEIKIVDDKLNPVMHGKEGELMIKGPGVMKQYYMNPEATKDVLSDGWLLTGDIAREDEDGLIYLVDRKKDVIITGGENIYPVEIEDFLCSHPKIQDSAVIGLSNQRLGEIPAAIIQIKKDLMLSKEEVNKYCEALPRYKRPRDIIFADVARNATGKIEKPLLRKRYGG